MKFSPPVYKEDACWNLFELYIPQVYKLNGGKTTAYTYEAFFASDGRSKKVPGMLKAIYWYENSSTISEDNVLSALLAIKKYFWKQGAVVIAICDES